MNRRFTTLFILVTGLLAAAVYSADRAAARGGVLLTVLAATAAIVGLLGFAAFARVVVLTERRRRAP